MKGLRSLLSKEWAGCIFYNLPISLGKVDFLEQEKKEIKKEKLVFKPLYEISKKIDYSNPYDFFKE